VPSAVDAAAIPVSSSPAVPVGSAAAAACRCLLRSFPRPLRALGKTFASNPLHLFRQSHPHSPPHTLPHPPSPIIFSYTHLPTCYIPTHPRIQHLLSHTHLPLLYSPTPICPHASTTLTSHTAPTLPHPPSPILFSYTHLPTCFTRTHLTYSPQPTYPPTTPRSSLRPYTPHLVPTPPFPHMLSRPHSPYLNLPIAVYPLTPTYPPYSPKYPNKPHPSSSHALKHSQSQCPLPSHLPHILPHTRSPRVLSHAPLSAFVRHLIIHREEHGHVHRESKKGCVHKHAG